jgi:hypothetical protein
VVRPETEKIKTSYSSDVCIPVDGVRNPSRLQDRAPLPSRRGDGREGEPDPVLVSLCRPRTAARIPPAH